jgi:CMP/dCMP kinase
MGKARTGPPYRSLSALPGRVLADKFASDRVQPEGYRMRTSAVDIVTVSREYGAGGSDFALGLGAALGWPVLDKNLVDRVAARLHMQCGAVQQRDEQAPGLFSRIASTLLISPPESPMQVETNDLVMPDSIAQAAHAEIVAAAAHPPIIIVGHGAQMIFQQRPGTMHVRLIGTPESRIERLRARDGGTPEQVAAEARRINSQRQAYVQRYYHQYWADPLLFDVQFNTARVTIEEAVACVASIVIARANASEPGAHADQMSSSNHG